jgi:hypothetical protein
VCTLLAVCVCVGCVLRPFIKSRRKRRKKIILFRWFSVSTIFGGPVFLLFISRCGPFIGNLLYKSSSEPERERGEKVSFSFYCSFFAMQQQQQQQQQRHTDATQVRQSSGLTCGFWWIPDDFLKEFIWWPSLLFFSLFFFFLLLRMNPLSNQHEPLEREREERESRRILL